MGRGLSGESKRDVLLLVGETGGRFRRVVEDAQLFEKAVSVIHITACQFSVSPFPSLPFPLLHSSPSPETKSNQSRGKKNDKNKLTPHNKPHSRSPAPRPTRPRTVADCSHSGPRSARGTSSSCTVCRRPAPDVGTRGRRGSSSALRRMCRRWARFASRGRSRGAGC